MPLGFHGEPVEVHVDASLRVVRETDEEEVAVETGLLDAAVMEDRQGLAAGLQALGHALGRMRAERDRLELEPRPIHARRERGGHGAGRCGWRVARPQRSGRTGDGQRRPGLALRYIAAEHGAEDLPQDDHAEDRGADDSQVRSAGFDPPPECGGAPREGRFEGVGRRTGA